jgi:hypothetical protein
MARKSTGRWKASRKTTRSRASKKSAAPAALAEETWFIHDDATTNPDKNMTLAGHLSGPWNDLAIVTIERIEIGETGWLARYRVGRD